MSSTERVLLRGGISVPAAVYVLVVDLEARGIHISRDGADLLVGPPNLITPDDDRALRASKPDILRLLDYLAQPGLDRHLFTDQRETRRELHD